MDAESEACRPRVPICSPPRLHRRQPAVIEIVAADLTISADEWTTKAASGPFRSGDITLDSGGAIVSETRGGFVGFSTVNPG